jgi:hypothetical protein
MFQKDRTLCSKKASETAADQAGLVGILKISFLFSFFETMIEDRSVI